MISCKKLFTSVKRELWLSLNILWIAQLRYIMRFKKWIRYRLIININILNKIMFAIHIYPK